MLKNKRIKFIGSKFPKWMNEIYSKKNINHTKHKRTHHITWKMTKESYLDRIKKTKQRASKYSTFVLEY